MSFAVVLTQPQLMLLITLKEIAELLLNPYISDGDINLLQEKAVTYHRSLRQVLPNYKHTINDHKSLHIAVRPSSHLRFPLSSTCCRNYFAAMDLAVFSV
jgi:hypothetical protein